VLLKLYINKYDWHYLTNKPINFYLFILQISIKKDAHLKFIEEKWSALSLPKEKFDLVVQLGGFHGEIEWVKFLAVLCSTISKVII
jgi:hypothetical protein